MSTPAMMIVLGTSRRGLRISLDALLINSNPRKL